MNILKQEVNSVIDTNYKKIPLSLLSKQKVCLKIVRSSIQYMIFTQTLDLLTKYSLIS